VKSCQSFVQAAVNSDRSGEVVKGKIITIRLPLAITLMAEIDS
jgi:hypothetical protein